MGFALNYLMIILRKKVAEMFGGFADFLYLCIVIQERITTAGGGCPV
jgi:hypothetical protein